MSEILKEFQRFWRQGSDSFPSRRKDFAAFKYDEAPHSPMLLAYLRKIVNCGGLVFRPYAEGRGAVGIGVRYGWHEYLAEAKLKGDKTLDDRQRQLAGYLDAAGHKEGWLVIFGRDRNKAWEEKIYWEDALFADKVLHL
ncbi:MAG: hypothetical protein LBL95_04820 [Deltaproteobacteria bacterium]|jgi:hypothetical protein|nr:hypothetical protein [Deltaproteobacteria bacterium]